MSGVSFLAPRGVYIVAAKRTPFGTFGGAVKHMTATDLCVVAARAAFQASGVDPKTVDSVFVGNVSQTSADTPYIARHVGLRSGVPIPVPALTVNRLCGSGFQSIVNGAQEILLGSADIVLTGGAESMSQAPFVLRDVRWGVRTGTDLVQRDSLFETLTDSFCATPMAVTAENLAKKYNISREDCDQYALSSQKRWAAAQQNQLFERELAPITLQGKKGETTFAVDEHPRPETTIEGLAKLKPVFLKNGVVTAGNASGISDGAGAVILASESAVKRFNLTPLARLVSWGISGVEPSIMGFGPVPAIQGALHKANLTLNDMSRVEINEAFAAQYLACEKELQLDREKTNVNGGAIALGHPTGASGARIMSHLTYELIRLRQKYAVGSACIGGGQGIALVIENVKL